MRAHTVRHIKTPLKIFMSKRVALALGVLWRIGYVCLDVGRMSRYVSDLKPHLETAQIGYKIIGSRAGFCVYTRASNSDLCQIWAKERIFSASVNAVFTSFCRKPSMSSSACLDLLFSISSRSNIKMKTLQTQIQSNTRRLCHISELQHLQSERDAALAPRWCL